MSSLLNALRPPEWVVDELQNRVVLFLNHVLMQEPQAQELPPTRNVPVPSPACRRCGGHNKIFDCRKSVG